MSELVEIHGAVHDEPTKGHDRLFIDENRSVAGIFDGSGGDELSEAVVQWLPAVLADSEVARESSEELFLTRVLSELDNLPEANYRKATAALASAKLRGPDLHLAFAHAGDSSIYFYDHDDDTLGRIAHTNTPYTEFDGQNYIDTSEFLGNFRNEDQIKPLVGKLVLPATARWSLVGFSDGVQDDDGRGIATPTLLEIIQTTAPSEVPAAVLDAVKKYDDASVFIMSRTEALSGSSEVSLAA